VLAAVRNLSSFADFVLKRVRHITESGASFYPTLGLAYIV